MKDLPISPAFSADVEIGAVEIKDGTADTRASVITDNATASATPNVLMTGGIYKNSADTYADNDASPLHTDVNGNLKVDVAADSSGGVEVVQDTAGDLNVTEANSGTIAGDTTSIDGKITACNTGAVTVATLTGGGVASDAADSGNPVKVGGKYTSGGVTLDDGDRGDLNLDAAGNLLVSNNTLISGEDQTADVMKVEHQYSYSYVAAAGADNVIKASAGFLHAIILGKWVTGGVVEVSDHASDGDGNVVIYLESGATDESGFPKTILVDAVFSTGITADITGTTNVTFIYR